MHHIRLTSLGYIHLVAYLCMYDYELEDRAIGLRSSQGKRIFPVTSVSRPALGPTLPPIQWVPGILSWGAKRGRGVTLTTHPHLVPRSRMSRSYTSSPPSATMACSSGTSLLFAYLCMFSRFIYLFVHFFTYLGIGISL
jgi:hypothetical protein